MTKFEPLGMPGYREPAQSPPPPPKRRWRGPNCPSDKVIEAQIWGRAYAAAIAHYGYAAGNSTGAAVVAQEAVALWRRWEQEQADAGL